MAKRKKMVPSARRPIAETEIRFARSFEIFIMEYRSIRSGTNKNSQHGIPSHVGCFEIKLQCGLVRLAKADYLEFAASRR